MYLERCMIYLYFNLYQKVRIDHLLQNCIIVFQVVRGGHRTGRVGRHVGCHGDTWYVELTEEEMEKKLGEH